ncbi:hypothetical protein IM40_01515 [Candidatus Paracaedimonas acanthamoebae]|nr:hypothetical protein IM40_01515 [Candidatus Paracaedimonas acanthamoebae]
MTESAERNGIQTVSFDTFTLRVEAEVLELSHILNQVDLETLELIMETIPELPSLNYQPPTILTIESLLKDSTAYEYHNNLISFDKWRFLPSSLIRTKRWLSVLEKHIQVESTFVAVGLGHVPAIIGWAKSKGYHAIRSK